MTLPRHFLGHGLPPIPNDVAAIALLFSRDEVATHHIGRSTDDLLCLSDDARLSRQLAHGLFLAFEGYDSDPREIHEIPECRAYLQALHHQWPYWMHFLAPVPDQWAMLLLCLLPNNTPTGIPAAPPGTRAIDTAALRRLLKQMTLAMMHLHEHHATPENDAQRLFMASTEAISAAMGQDL